MRYSCTVTGITMRYSLMMPMALAVRRTGTTKPGAWVQGAPRWHGDEA